MPNRHDAFVRRENVKSFQIRLETETDPIKRKLLADLLAKETGVAPEPPKPYGPPEPR